MSWPPRISSSFPPRNPPSMRRDYMLALPNAAGTFDRRGPFAATRVPDSQNIQIQKTTGEVVTIEDRINMPLESQARARCILTDVLTNVSFEVVQARTFSTFIECLVSRSQADL